ncbi:hypothetical protein [Nocardia aurea]|uniref:hypothetical protein n=1 Tax=Nocardia aurea TaxID=2144174 RepID=UPI000D69F6F1|nr:hypothetical protein [Nocardia aurea]
MVFAGEAQLGLAELQDLVVDQARVFGPFDSRILELRHRICLLLEGMGQVDDAIATLRELVDEVAERHGQQHNMTRKLTNDLDRMRRTQ